MILGMIIILTQNIYSNRPILMKIGYGFVMFALMITPAVWSVYTVMNPGSNASLPAAYSGKSTKGGDRNSLSVNQTLVDFFTGKHAGCPLFNGGANVHAGG